MRRSKNTNVIDKSYKNNDSVILTDDFNIVDNSSSSDIDIDSNFNPDNEPELDNNVPNELSKTVTDDSLKSYLQEIGKIPLLSHEKEVELAKTIYDFNELERKIKNNDKKTISDDEYDKMKSAATYSKKKLVKANLRLVVSIAKKYIGRGLPLLDLIQEGNIGLIKASGKFDYKKGYRFSTYASWWIQQSITRSLAEKSRLIRIPVHLLETFSKSRKAAREMSLLNGCPPTSDELAYSIGIPLPKLMAALESTQPVLSIESPAGSSEDSSKIVDTIVDESSIMPEKFVDRNGLNEEIKKLLTKLTEKEKEVLISRYGLNGNKAPKTLEQIGELYNISRERVRQIETRAICKLKKICAKNKDIEEAVKDYLDNMS